MRIPIPKAYDTVMNWIACHVLPPNKPIGLTLFGYAVTWLDLALVAYPTAAAVVLGLVYGYMLWWLAAVALSMAFAWMVVRWFL